MISQDRITHTVPMTIHLSSYNEIDKFHETIDCQCFIASNLKAVPRRVLGNLDCYENVNLTSLDNFPDYVGGNFYCFGASNLPYKELFKVVDAVKGEIFYSSMDIPEDKDKIRRDRDVNSILKDDDLGNLDV